MQTKNIKKQHNLKVNWYFRGLDFCFLCSLLNIQISFSQNINCRPSHPELLITSSSLQYALTPQESKLPPVIRALLIAYQDSIDTAIPLENSKGILRLKNNLEHPWSSPHHRFDLKAWQSLSKQQQTKLWQDLGFKNFEQVLNRATLSEQLLQIYPKQNTLPKTFLPKNFEPGRLRDEVFFKKLYGMSKAEVAKSLKIIHWGKQRLKVTSLHQIDKRLSAIHKDLKRCFKRFKRYYEPSAGTFHWRTIKGTSRLSVHSFGAAIDIGVKYSNYWKWTLKVYGADRQGLIPYKNNFPWEIVKIFERYGFIWGGWWYHHDTMHFEYRPELLVDIK